MTTFVSREATRDAIAALFTPYKGTGQLLKEVYNNWPQVGTMNGLSPVLVIISNGSELDMEAFHTNNVSHTMQIISMVQSASPTDTTVTRAKAMDKIDDLQRLIFQVIRGATQNAAWDNIYFTGTSAVENVLVGVGSVYMTEVFTVNVRKLG